MWKHKLLEHTEEEVSFTMKVLKKHYSAFERIVTESTLITYTTMTPATSLTPSLATKGAVFVD